jgi:putative spermidine/putrescine transport system ATP-binding protein
MDGTVRERFFLGSQWLYKVDTPAGALAVLAVNDGTRTAEEGSVTGLDWAPAQVRVLRPEPSEVAR